MTSLIKTESNGSTETEQALFAGGCGCAAGCNPMQNDELVRDGPLVYDYARRHHLPDADEADLMQMVLRVVVSAGYAG